MPAAPSSAGVEAVELAAAAGLDLDGWQQDVLFDALGERKDGNWAAAEVALLVPRQNGKGSVLEARELAGLFLFGERLILHSAHEFKTASEAFRRVWFLIQNTPDLDRRVARVRTSHGDEGIELKGGQRLRFVARSTGSGRGFSGDTVILDESYNLSARALSALLPTLSARPNSQLWYTSSAPLDGPESAVLRRLCKRGRQGVSPRLAYLEYCATTDADLDDREAWADANPGMGIRIPEEAVETERGALDPADFGRERLGIWFDIDELGEHVIAPEAWAACQDDKSGPVGPVAFALDVANDRGSAAFGVAGKSGRGGIHLEVVDHRSGTGWVVERAQELQTKWGGQLAVADGDPACSLLPELLDAGVKVQLVKRGEHAQACGVLYDRIENGTVKHLGPFAQPELHKAVAGAARVDMGDSWRWSRKNSAVDICPLVAVTLAAWAFSQNVPVPVPLVAWR